MLLALLFVAGCRFDMPAYAVTASSMRTLMSGVMTATTSTTTAVRRTASQLRSAATGYVDPAEECDDSSTVDGDGCAADCRLESGGDGRLNANEECDDGNTEIPTNVLSASSRGAAMTG